MFKEVDVPKSRGALGTGANACPAGADAERGAGVQLEPFAGAVSTGGQHTGAGEHGRA